MQFIHDLEEVVVFLHHLDKKAIKYDRKKIKKMKKHEVGRQKAWKLIKICYDDGYFRMVTKKGKIVTYGFGC